MADHLAEGWQSSLLTSNAVGYGGQEKLEVGISKTESQIRLTSLRIRASVCGQHKKSTPAVHF
ncbi:MAG: hypothetical protein A2Y57_00665 [Candidatus Woykebacteria bacterium RBG_13_40_7b]|uniref:Uncharacterized protein n=1 Tax=Candidatus Woykebacteria bacterium RBG_13_40_7b TaxID=1802594 RepID=A0A1G1W8L7_9BACT|nr:MAG: hypothetical protein A2Y57_00665 [Candidatus Woykebacteria bacterium RBG_13_40_7b]